MTSRLLATLLFVLAHGPVLRAQVERRGRVFDVRSLFEERSVQGLLVASPSLREDEDGSLDLGFAEGQGGEDELWNPERLADLIRRTIDPDSWRNTRNGIEIGNGQLAIVQTPDVLDRIDSLIALLEAREARTFGVDLAIVPPESLEKAAPLSIRPGSAPWLEGDVLERAVAADPARAAVLCAQAAEGAPANLQPAAVALFLGDMEVNQTGVTPVLSPVVEPAYIGLHAEALVRSGPVNGRLRVDLRVGRAGMRGKPERRRVLAADLDLPVIGAEETATSIAVEEGRTVLAGLFSPGTLPSEAPGDMRTGSFAVLVRVRSWTPAVGDAARAGIPGLIEAGALLFEPRDHYISPSFGRTSRPAPARPRSELVLDAAAAALDPVDPDAARERMALAREALLVNGPEEDIRKVRLALARLAGEELRTVTIDIWQGPVEAADLSGQAGSSVLLDPSWIDRIASRPGLRARLSGVHGARMALASVVTRNIVTDLDMISGGTGFTVIVAADPDVQAIGAGIILNASSGIVPGEPWAQLEVNGELARPPVLGRQARARSSLEAKPAAPGAAAPIEAAAGWVAIDLPDEDTDIWRHLLTAPLGRPVLLNALPDTSAPGRTRALVAVVHETPLP